MINKLIAGYKKFRLEHYEINNTYDPLVIYGQKPKFLVIACSDSRVDPAIITGCKPGEVFSVRNIANLVPPYKEQTRYFSVTSALEFGVNQLGVKDIIILGHSCCGGIQATLEFDFNTSPDNYNHIHSWLQIAKEAKNITEAECQSNEFEKKLHFCEKTSLKISLNNLKTFPWIIEKVRKKELNLHGWYFDLATGIIERYDDEKKKFISLA